MWGTTCPTTQCCIPEEWKRQQHRWKNVRSHQVTSASFHQPNFTHVTVITCNKITQKYCKKYISIIQNIEEYSLPGCDGTQSGRTLLSSRMCKYSTIMHGITSQRQNSSYALQWDPQISCNRSEWKFYRKLCWKLRNVTGHYTNILVYDTVQSVGSHLYCGGIVSHDILRREAVGCSATPLTVWQGTQCTTQSLSPWTFRSHVTCLVTAAIKHRPDAMLWT